MKKRTFRDILLNEKLSFYQDILDSVPIMESKEFTGGEQKVYTNDRGQYVSVGRHVEGEDNRKKLRGWWKEYTDQSFTSFVDPMLNIINNLYVKWLDAKGDKEKLKKIKADTIKFTYKEQFLFSDKEEKKILIVSLRPTEGRYNTSVHINTIFDKDKMGKENLHIYDIDDNHRKILHNWKYIGECVNENGIVHIFEC